MIQPAFNFDGETFDRQHDAVRLTGQLERVYVVMRDGRWRTISQIARAAAPGSEASISARIRDLRKPKFGGHTVERKRILNGHYKYRLLEV